MNQPDSNTGTNNDPIDDILEFAVGETRCDKSSGSQLISLFTVPVLGALFALIIFWPGTDRYWDRWIRNPNYRLLTRILLLLLILFIIDRLVARYRARNNTCV